MNPETDPPKAETEAARNERIDHILDELYWMMEHGETSRARAVIRALEEHGEERKLLWMVADKFDGKIALELHPLPKNWSFKTYIEPEHPFIIILEARHQ
jgi:hypothetical protein